MAVYGYIFVDIEKKYRVPASEQQQTIANYCQDNGLTLDALYTEQYISAWRPFVERTQAKMLLEACTDDDIIVGIRSDAIFCRPKEGLLLIDTLAQKNISLHIIELGGDIVRPTERKLVVSNGIAGAVNRLLSNLAERERPQREATGTNRPQE